MLTSLFSPTFFIRKISLGKFGTFKANALIGQPFGLTYQIINNQGDIKPARNMALEDVEETEADNREIFDTKDAQKLTFEEIEKMKQEISDGTEKESVWRIFCTLTLGNFAYQ